MLSHMTSVAPASSASATCSMRSHSTSTMRPGQRSRALCTASLMERLPKWLSLMRTPSERLPRWLTAPPALTAAFSSERRPGVVFRVSHILVAGFASRAAST